MYLKAYLDRAGILALVIISMNIVNKKLPADTTNERVHFLSMIIRQSSSSVLPDECLHRVRNDGTSNDHRATTDDGHCVRQ